MSSTYTIIITNQSGSPKVYNVYSDPPGIEGGGEQSTKAVMWHKTRSLPVGSKATFKYSSAYSAVIGYTSPFSNKLKVGDTVDEQGSIVANIGTIRDNSSVVFVDKSFAITELNRTFTKSSIQILADNGIPTPNHYVVGLARQQEGETPAPVAVVELKPNVDYTFKPKSAVFVRATGPVDAGKIHTPSDQKDIDDKKVAKVEFNDPYKVATVSGQGDGTFEVVYS